MTPAQKYQLLAAAIRQAREFKRAGLRLRFPTATTQEIETKLARIWLHARS